MDHRGADSFTSTIRVGLALAVLLSDFWLGAQIFSLGRKAWSLRNGDYEEHQIKCRMSSTRPQVKMVLGGLCTVRCPRFKIG